METLVLNARYEPIATIPWQRAITLVFDGKVEVVEEYEDRFVRTVTLEFKMPCIVRFLKFVRGKNKGVRFSRENVYLRDKGTCQYCGKKVPRSEFTYDHVLPKARGGPTNWENVVVSCVACNQRKAGRTPEEARMSLLQRPERPTKVSDTLRFTFTWNKGMPEPWKTWLKSVAYWHAELDNDN